MAARKRLKSESFKKYRENLRKEAAMDKHRAKGKMIFNSSEFGTLSYSDGKGSYLGVKCSKTWYMPNARYMAKAFPTPGGLI